MATRHFVAKKIGDRYVTVAQAEPGVATAWTIGGMTLITLGLKLRGLKSLVALGGGACMIHHAVTGRNLMAELCSSFSGQCGHRIPEKGASYQHDYKGPVGQVPEDSVDEQVMESFPASDPPARSTTTATL